MGWLRRLFHKHQWRDLFTFASCIEMTIPTGEQRVLSRAVMMECALCGAKQRRALREGEA